jgi:hypothetical protein
VRKLQEAVKFARETANNAQAEEVKVGEGIFGYIFSYDFHSAPHDWLRSALQRD